MKRCDAWLEIEDRSGYCKHKLGHASVHQLEPTRGERETMTTQTENETRADRATRTLDKAGDAYSSDREEAAVDLMTDLLHMLDTWYGIEPEDAHRMAWHHFIAERN